MGVICWMSDCILSTCIAVAGDRARARQESSRLYGTDVPLGGEKKIHVGWWERGSSGRSVRTARGIITASLSEEAT